MISGCTARFRALVARPGCVMAPGVADALAARLVALEGYDVVYMTGFGTSLTRLGAPDVGLLTATEMVDNAARIVDASRAAGHRRCRHRLRQSDQHAAHDP
jgi:2,3-dimethylmalate lyase